MPGAPDILGESESILETKDKISRAAKINRPIMILGERGTGKELAAARLHYLSKRWEKPYITLNCAALNSNLLDSELFGYEAGAFTGATKRRAGRFEAADGGTLFLDEISHLTLEAQAKLLRVVEYGRFQLVGSPQELSVDVRVLAATNADLDQMCQNGRFLPDLWDRLSFEIITLPPLRDRPGDSLLLAQIFAARMAQEMGHSHLPTFTPKAKKLLETYSWPGNIRELKNVVERAVYRGSEIIDDLHLEEIDGKRPKDKRPKKEEPNNFKKEPDLEKEPDLDINFPLEDGEFDRIINQTSQNLMNQALVLAKYNQRKAAKLLGLSYHRFRFIWGKFDTTVKSPEIEKT